MKVNNPTRYNLLIENAKITVPAEGSASVPDEQWNEWLDNFAGAKGWASLLSVEPDGNEFAPVPSIPSNEPPPDGAAQEAETDPAKGVGKPTDEDIANAIRGLDADNDANWTSKGAPQVKAIEEALGGRQISADDRNRVWTPELAAELGADTGE